MLFATVVQWCNFWEIWSVPEMKCVCLCEFTKVLLFVGFEELHVFHEIIFLEIHFFLHFSCKNLSTIHLCREKDQCLCHFFQEIKLCEHSSKICIPVFNFFAHFF